MSQKYLILGGTRSGKSRHAEHLVIEKCLNSNLNAHYIATAQSLDNEMKARIERHQKDRATHSEALQTQVNMHHFSWNLIEEPLKLAQVINQFGSKDCLLIECLTLWVNNCMHHQNWPERKPELIAALQQSKSTIVIVSNEVGQGIVPANQLARTFIDEMGWLHQELATICDHVSVITAGLVQKLK